MLSEPPDLAADSIRAALRDGWRSGATSLTYQAVGFGSHHWLAADAGGDELFLTVDDLATKRRSSDDTTGAAFGRLECAFATALSLRHEAGLDFVVAPVPAADGRLLARLGDRYSLVVHPYIAARRTGQDGAFDTGSDRIEVLRMLIAVHTATARPPRADDLTVPRLAELRAAMSEIATPWQAGPYATRARDLLARHAADLTVLLAAYADLAARVAARPDRMVITHGEPHSANVLRAAAGLVLVDWDTVLLAPPERDLWALAEADATILPAYAAATGVAIDDDALSLYRLWFDLAEISEYIGLFRDHHRHTADTAEAWRNLRHFLQPAVRWPGLLGRQISTDNG